MNGSVSELYCIESVAAQQGIQGKEYDSEALSRPSIHQCSWFCAYRMGTHLSQRQPSEIEEIATEFIRVTREKLQMSCRDEDYIINMDQTPVPFSYDPKKTIEVVGRRTIHIRKSTCDMKCATCALTVTASGKMITPLFVFKGNN